MRAARFHGQKDLRVEEIPEPQCGPGEVKVALAFAGICGTDLHEWLGEYTMTPERQSERSQQWVLTSPGGPTFTPTPESPHPLTKECIPITFGHEFSGVIHEVGPNVKDLEVGQSVVVQPNLFCRQCDACKSGFENVCDEGMGFIGLSGGGGGFSDYVVLPAHMCLNLPQNVPLEYGALVEPLAVGAHAVLASNIKAGDKVLVIGGGPIGLAVLQAIKARNAGLVITAEIAAARQRFAKEFGADHIIDPSTEDVLSKTRELCSGVFPDLVFDCAGVPKSLETACRAVRAGGTVVNLAIWEKPVPFDPNWLVFKEAKYMATLGYRRSDFEFVIGGLAAGTIKPGQMITGKIKLEDIVDKGFRALTEDKETNVKILVDLNA